MLTKTNFMQYMECPIYLWLVKHRPDLIPEDTPETERIFAMGNEVDDLARKLFTGGVEVKGFNMQGWQNTQKLMAGPDKIFFQPTVVAGPLTCRADILVRKEKTGDWDINEVKMAASVKREYPYDVAFQRICFENAGIKIVRANLVHINNKYVRRGDVEPEKLFASEDITDEVNDKTPEVKENIEKALRVAEGREIPDVELLESCPRPKTCEYIKYYCDGIPKVYSIAGELPSKCLLALLERKILNPEKIPSKILASIGYEPEIEFTKIDAPAIRKELKKLKYPLYFFDYETYSSAIPAFDGTRPYQNVPFQYSLLVKEKPTAAIRQIEFLKRTFENPVPDLLSQLKRDIGSRGSVVVWHAPFEKGCNEEMARMEPQYVDFLKSVNNRIFDLMLIFKFKNHLYTKSEFQKSASLKKVLPAMCPELSYESLAIQEGQKASASWPILTSDKTSESEKAKLANDMLTYCKRDTEAMVCILNRVSNEIK
jgi:hypothetical protein